MDTPFENVRYEEGLPVKIVDLFYNRPYLVTDHWHPSVEILVPIAGELLLNENGKDYYVNPGEVFIVQANHIHSAQHTDRLPFYRGYALQIESVFFQKYCPNFDSYDLRIPDKEIASEIISVCFQIIGHFSSNAEYKKVNIKAYTTLLASLILENLLIDKDVRKEKKSKKSKEVDIIEYIQKNYKENILISDIAEYFGVTQSYLSRFFKEKIGMNIKDYLEMIRLNSAKDDLLETDLSILDIALNNGFANPKSFYTLFKKTYQMTPNKYRATKKSGKSLLN